MIRRHLGLQAAAGSDAAVAHMSAVDQLLGAAIAEDAPQRAFVLVPAGGAEDEEPGKALPGHIDEGAHIGRSAARPALLFEGLYPTLQPLDLMLQRERGCIRIVVAVLEAQQYPALDEHLIA